MKKSLQELQARSGSMAIQPRAAKMALEAKSPTDAFNLALAATYHKCDAEQVRYLAMIKRDYGIETLKCFLEEKNNFALASYFIDKVTVALAYIDFCQAVPTLATSEPVMMVKVSKLIEEIVVTFKDDLQGVLSVQTKASMMCKERIDKYGSDLMHIKIMFANSVPMRENSVFFEKAGSVLFFIGLAVAERYGLYFMQRMPMFIVGKN